MQVYLIIDIEVIDQALYSEYVRKVPATVEKYGGRYLARGGNIRTLSGDWRPERIILIEFPSAEALRGWISSPDYAALRDIRERSTRDRAIIVEGVPSSGE
ncbi:MAG: DUF1330 domain-containing protein [Candidatus Abyssobacteria bacterium SURF_5]|uniref:DUF1330 domain-containing protein n=1 Tax=Abyssobacteria bacterium (strain SURF_5) TaxID=2093360 RepID=A0A3A4NSA1_ABYX5|nr:MAG: DUF1330 domain-containing protein [Candidatus Abyssubacteria bacterium SURF_5]